MIALAMTVVLAGGAAASHGDIHSNTICDCVGVEMSTHGPGDAVGGGPPEAVLYCKDKKGMDVFNGD